MTKLTKVADLELESES